MDLKEVLIAIATQKSNRSSKSKGFNAKSSSGQSNDQVNQSSLDDSLKFALKNHVDLNQPFDKNSSYIMKLFEVHENVESLPINYNKISPNQLNQDGDTLMHLAVRHRRSSNSLLLQLLPLVNINSKNKNGDTALHVACQLGHLSMIYFLISQNSNVKAVNKDGNTALHLLCAICPEDVDVKYFIDNGADLNAKNSDGNTPLHLAAMNGKLTNFIKSLVYFGADVYIFNNRSQSALTLLEAHHGEENVNTIVNLSKKYRQCVDEESSQYLFTLFQALLAKAGTSTGFVSSQACNFSFEIGLLERALHRSNIRSQFIRTEINNAVSQLRNENLGDFQAIFSFFMSAGIGTELSQRCATLCVQNNLLSIQKLALHSLANPNNGLQFLGLTSDDFALVEVVLQPYRLNLSNSKVDSKVNITNDSQLGSEYNSFLAISKSNAATPHTESMFSSTPMSMNDIQWEPITPLTMNKLPQEDGSASENDNDEEVDDNNASSNQVVETENQHASSGDESMVSVWSEEEASDNDNNDNAVDNDINDGVKGNVDTSDHFSRVSSRQQSPTSLELPSSSSEIILETKSIPQEDHVEIECDHESESELEDINHNETSIATSTNNDNTVSVATSNPSVVSQSPINIIAEAMNSNESSQVVTAPTQIANNNVEESEEESDEDNENANDNESSDESDSESESDNGKNLSSNPFRSPNSTNVSQVEERREKEEPPKPANVLTSQELSRRRDIASGMTLTQLVFMLKEELYDRLKAGSLSDTIRSSCQLLECETTGNLKQDAVNAVIHLPNCSL